MEGHILVVDDDPEILRLIAAYLEQAGFEVRTETNGQAALDCMAAKKPDLVVLDLMLPKINGFEVTKIMRAKAELASIPVIMLTARLDETDRILGLELGADDYVNKPFNPRELVARIRAVLRRTKHPNSTADPARDPKLLSCGELRIDIDRHLVRVKDQEVSLTKTEYSILEALAANLGYTLSRDELLERALGYSYEGMGRTLDTHIRNLRRKIEVDPEHPQLVETVHGIGYRLRKPGAPT
jgi:two-component system alkaline phosphatase synthesis response regulator PhoP